VLLCLRMDWKTFKALAVYEKSLDDFSGALCTSNALSKDILQQIQMFHKEIKN